MSKDLGIFFIKGVVCIDGEIHINIDSEYKDFNRISFNSWEAFQVFHESDYHPIAEQYELTPLSKYNDGECGILKVNRSPYLMTFQQSNGRYLDILPKCFLISTADERVEVISFSDPSVS